MQYKHKWYSVSMWPRKHNVGDMYHLKQYGVGKVVVCEALKDEISKQKFWCNTVRFTKPDGSQFDVVFKRNAATTTILVFPSAGSEHNLPTTFPLALLKGTFEEQLGDQKRGVDMILQKMNLQEIHPEHVESWAHFWSTCPAGQFVLATSASPFRLPRTQVDLTHLVVKKKKLNCVDDGNRNVGVIYMPYQAQLFSSLYNECVHAKGSSSVFTGKNKMLHVDQNYYNPIINYYNIL